MYVYTYMYVLAILAKFLKSMIATNWKTGFGEQNPNRHYVNVTERGLAHHRWRGEGELSDNYHFSN
jgi:hypothetical protein